MLNPEYNILKWAGSSLGYTHNEKSIVKMRDRKCTEETRSKISIARLGKSLSEETRLKMALAKKGKIHKDETIIKFKIAAASRAQKISVFDVVNNKKIEYDSIATAAKSLEIKPAIILNYINRNQIKPYKKRYIFSKV
uniref:Nuclease associated modular domain-containing protein n=1 Tax=Dactylella sp. TaxID=1814903 RepID=A0A482DRJ5_9PEZI|nr:hypothetical protein [Dactylella sp.]